MINNKSFIFSLNLLLILLLTACVISPWKSQTYINQDNSHTQLAKRVPKNENNKYYFINNAFIYIDVIGLSKDNAWDWYNENAPYEIRIYVQGIEQYHFECKLHNVTFESSITKYNIDTKINLPESNKFSKVGHTKDIAYSGFYLGNGYYFDFKAKEIVNILIDLEVISVDGFSERKLINFRLVPKLKSGLFKFITV